MSWSHVAARSSLPSGWALPLLTDDGPGVYRLLRGGKRKIVDDFLGTLLDPVEAQRASLARVLSSAEGTEMGRQLRGVRSLGDYRASLPIRPSSAFEEDLQRVAAGARGVLTRHAVRSLVKTSGTSGAPKLLPVTDPWREEVAAAQALWVLAMVREQPELSTGKVLTAVGAAVEGHSAGGLPYGSNTGRMQGEQPWWVRARYAVPREVFSIDEPELRTYVLLRLALGQDVRSWTTANPSTLLAMARFARRHEENLRADLRDGTLRRGPAAGADLRKVLPWRLGRRALPEGFRFGEVWNLAAINCWKGGFSQHFLDMLPEAFGKLPPIREAGISASEGYFAIPLHSSWGGGVAWLGGHLLEFAPEEGDGEVKWAHEVEVGARYRLIISTTAGLYRYDLADLVRVVGWYGGAPLLVFERKTASVLSVVGEKITEIQLLQAGNAVFGASLAGISAGIHMAERPYLVVFAEAPRVPGAEEALDRALAALNGEYASKRATDRLGPPALRYLPPGATARLRAEAEARGVAPGQYKEPLLLHAEALAAWEARG